MDFDTLINQIYEAAFVPNLWSGTIQSICDASGSYGGVFFATSPPYSDWVSSPALAPLFLEFVENGWAERNTRPTTTIARRFAGFVACHELFPLSTIEIDPIKSFLVSKGLGWSGGMVTPAPSGELLVFSFERQYRDGPFTRELLDSLNRLSVHLRRSAVISGRINLERARAGNEVLQAFGLPSAVISRANRILLMNDLFGPYIPEVIQDRLDRVKIIDKGADELFEQALLSIGRGVCLGQSVHSIPIPASSRRKPLILHVVPIRRSAVDIMSGASCLIVLTELKPGCVPDAGLLQYLFGLTPAEARVARAIASGSQIKEVASNHNLSVETIRAQLKSVFAKTGASRQADLIAMVTGALLVRD